MIKSKVALRQKIEKDKSMNVKPQRKYDLEDRLVNFSRAVIQFRKTMERSYSGDYLGNQLLRSGISPSLNYAEAQAAESRRDFIHKMKICLKELRETSVSIKIIQDSISCDESLLIELQTECKQLLAIFQKSISTSEKKPTQKT